MTKRSTRHSLLMSAISLLLCASMLIGTTFAWFTDSVTSTGNKIQSGTLKVDLELLDKKTNTWSSLKTVTDPVYDYEKWEPGFVDAKVFKIRNEGTLALKWVAKFVTEGTVTKLADVIDVYVKEGATSYPADRDFTGYDKVGTLAQFINNITATTNGVLYENDNVDGTGTDEAYLGIMLKMQEDAGNDYQNLSLIENGNGTFDIQIYATQLTAEEDSFGDDYDNLATYPDGSYIPDTTAVTVDVENGTFSYANKSDTVRISGQSDQSTVEIKLAHTNDHKIAVVADGADVIAYDIEVIGFTAGTDVTVEIFVGTGLGNINLYHEGTLMNADAYSYDLDTGYVTFTTDDFSVYAVQYLPTYVKDGIQYLESDDGEVTLFKVTKSFEGNTVTVPEGVTTIGGYAFASNNEIDTIVLPDTVTTLEDKAFRDTSASTVVLNEGLTEIPYQTFRNASNLEEVVIPSTVTTIKDSAFQNSGIKELTLPETVTTLEYGSCRDMKMVETVVIDGDPEIANYAFRACTNLREVFITGNPTFLGSNMVFCNKENNDASNIAFFVSNQEVADKLTAALAGAVSYGKNIEGKAPNFPYTIIAGNYEKLDEGFYKLVEDRKTMFYITSEEGLVNFSAWRNSTNSVGEGNVAYVNLTTNIDMSGYDYTAFNGHYVNFDGRNHTISNLNAKQGLSGKGGLASYGGAAVIKNLVLDNATVEGCQVGLFLGQPEGATIENCFVTGDNTVIWKQNYTSDYVETWGGIGAITGHNNSGNINAKIVNGATVTLNYNGMTTNSTYVDDLTGYGFANSGVVTNNGTVKVFKPVLAEAATSEELAEVIENASKNLEDTTVISLSEGTYETDINLTLAELGKQDGNITFKAEEGKEVVFEGTTTIGYYERGEGAATWNGSVTFENITFNHSEALTHSLDVQSVSGGVHLKNCTIIGDGEYGIGSSAGNNTGNSTIIGCTFENAAMQIYGNFGTGLVIDDCTFNDSRINVQGGNSVTVQNCTFDNVLTDANVGDSFYLVRSNSTPITVKNCTAEIDSTVTGVASTQAKWGIFFNRGTTNWTVENVALTISDAALAQPELLILKTTNTGVINTTNLTVNGVAQ